MTNRTLASLLLAGSVALSACIDDSPTGVRPGAPAPSASAAAGRHLVVFSAGVPADFEARVAALGGKVELKLEKLGGAAVSGLNAAAVESLRQAGGIAAVDADQEVVLDQPFEGGTLEATSGAESQSNPATATRFPYQWHHRAIRADAAWAGSPLALGSAGVRVAILDTGIDYTWPDLAGLVDEERSRSFVPSDTVPLKALFAGRKDFTDLNGHGTHVASTVSSKGSVVAGVSSKTTLIAVKVLGARGNGSSSGVLAGIEYAATPLARGGAGADVINMSLGSSFNRRDASARGGDSPSYLALINRAINYAHQQGVTVVVSAGNSAADLDHDKNGYKTYCSSPNVICVSATGPVDGFLSGPQAYVAGFTNLDVPSIYSNYGRSAVNVAAPGGNYTLNAAGTAVVSGGYVWQACSSSRTSYVAVSAGSADSTFVKHACASSPYRISGYSGTSMASPHVAGLAAILVQTHGRSPDAIRAAIESSANDLGEPGKDPHFGKGRINVARALGLE